MLSLRQLIARAADRDGPRPWHPYYPNSRNPSRLWFCFVFVTRYCGLADLAESLPTTARKLSILVVRILGLWLSLFKFPYEWVFFERPMNDSYKKVLLSGWRGMPASNLLLVETKNKRQE
jgi:hypothetical protein